MMDEVHEPTPEERGYLIPPGAPPPTAIGAGTPPAPERRQHPATGLEAAELLRSAVGLLIGVASTGIEAVLAELTARRSGRGARH